MPGENVGNNFNIKFYYIDSNGEYHPISKFDEIRATDIALSEEGEAMAWAFWEGLEIVKRSDKE